MRRIFVPLLAASLLAMVACEFDWYDPTGYHDCRPFGGDGWTHVIQDPENCGGCEIRCPEGVPCANYECQLNTVMHCGAADRQCVAVGGEGALGGGTQARARVAGEPRRLVLDLREVDVREERPGEDERREVGPGDARVTAVSAVERPEEAPRRRTPRRRSPRTRARRGRRWPRRRPPGRAPRTCGSRPRGDAASSRSQERCRG